jgi:hypothetical protein
MTKYKKHTIEVTQKHIDEGSPTSCNGCALSLAFHDSLVKAYGSQKYRVITNMSDGDVSLHYSHDGIIFGANLDSDIINLQYKIDAFVNEYDNNFLANDGHNTMPLANFTPKHCVPFTFDVRLPV